MNLEDAIKVRECLKELTHNEEDFAWGPTLAFAKERKAEVTQIINNEIEVLNGRNDAKKQP